ncbi:TonB-dependent receptor plug domain-containing protein [Bradyrhizobium barranii]|uniref:TonB-dependent receptor plug domain-containing protein n=1 Tax=Bradyrhizobium barranii TaxID=2992140 RepID=UPI0038B6D44D
MLLADESSAFAQSSGAARELPPIEVSGGETKPHKRLPASRRASKPVPANRGHVPQPTQAPASDARSVASGAKGPPGMASEITVSGDEINARPFMRPGEALEVVPGLIVTQHSGEGKANQYFLRGYNFDHGTDLAIYVDDVPVNMRTHAHGQGYADLNWLIPETISAMDVRKGPYFADESDFASVRAGPGCLDSAPLDLSGFLPGYAERGALRFCRCVGRA